MYKILIGTTDGVPRIGAASAHDCAITDKVWPSQLRYRVTARTAEGQIIITTATQARKIGATVIAAFPRADHAHSRSAR